MVHYLAGRSHQRMVHCDHEGMDMLPNNAQLILRVPRNIPHAITPPLTAYKAGWIPAFMFFPPNSDPTI